MITHYDWSGGREAVMRFGPAEGPVVVAALPLFEEANRTRAFAVAILRGLAERGIASALPDIPGQGESLVPTEAMTILRMQDAFGAAVAAIAGEAPSFALGIRSGALLDALALVSGRWHFAPQDGATLLRELTRVKQAEVGRETKLNEYWFLDSTLPDDAPDPPVAIAGNLVAPDLLTELAAKSPWDSNYTGEIPLRTVRLDSDPRDADLKLAGAPLWRRAEPDNDHGLADALAADIAIWVHTCAG